MAIGAERALDWGVILDQKKGSKSSSDLPSGSIFRFRASRIVAGMRISSLSARGITTEGKEVSASTNAGVLFSCS